MMYRYYIPTFITAAAASFALTPLVRRVSIKKGWLDKAGHRKVHKKPVPLLGGLAIYAGFILSTVFFMLTGAFAGDINKFWGLLAGSFIILLVGIADDIRGLSPRRKLLYQVAAATVAYIFGYVIIKVTHPLGGSFYIPALFSMALTIFWIVGFTNAVNLLDGLDGLSSGVVAIISGSLFFAAIKGGNYFVAILSLGIAGSCLGFLPHNFYPAKIFMGDTGSMFLGFCLALISIEGAYKGSTFITLFIPIIAMGVPVVDTSLSILRRLVKRNHVFKADKEHIHHKLLLGGSHREAVVRLYFLTACFGLIAISFTGMNEVWVFFALLATGALTLRWVVNSGFLDFADEHKEES